VLPRARCALRADARSRALLSNYRAPIDDHHGALCENVGFCSDETFGSHHGNPVCSTRAPERTQLADLSHILLNPAGSRQYSEGASCRGYDFIAPFDADGHTGPALWQKYRADRRVRQVRQDKEDEARCLVYKLGETDLARWVFDYNANDNNDDEAGYMFGAHRFSPGEYVSISGHDRKLRPFRGDAVDAALLPMGLINSFALELKL
jgi:hypothetical protein